MATQVHINGSNISEMIAAAVKEAVQQVTKEVLATNAVENKRVQDHGFDIRGQILANAHWLWKLARSYHVEDDDPKGVPGPSPFPPPLTITVSGTKDEFYALVLLQQHRDNRHVHEAAFIRGETTSSVDEALRKLLHTTTALHEIGDRGYYSGGAVLNPDTYVYLEGLGRIFRASGKCDDCEEQVWT
ncbi:hypothetical protein LTR17_002519 [Elasticomyces elasticus]|nr:hypothetical protein LTR17_002519 [Elasticomyces elasticus]